MMFLRKMTGRFWLTLKFDKYNVNTADRGAYTDNNMISLQKY